MRRHPDSFRLRHLVAPGAVALASLSPLLSRSRTGRRLIAIGGSAYLAGVAAAVAKAQPQHHDASVPALVAAFPVMLAAWGAGFITSVAEDLTKGDR